MLNRTLDSRRLMLQARERVAVGLIVASQVLKS